MRNPPWQRDELILALDLYFRHPPQSVNQAHPAVVALSNLLNSLPIHENRPEAQSFRSTNAVYMKLSNFMRFDPSHSGSGLPRGGRLEEEIWKEYASNRESLRKVAVAIAAGYPTLDEGISSDEEEESFPEGRVLYRLHRQRERNPRLVSKKKAAAKDLACEVCGFDFEEAYGEIGRGFIECHHTVPISEYEPNRKTRLQDLILVCSNCHRMLHRRRPWLTAEELKQLVVLL